MDVTHQDAYKVVQVRHRDPQAQDIHAQGTPFLIWKTVWFYRKTLHNRIINLHPLPTESSRLCRRNPLMGSQRRFCGADAHERREEGSVPRGLRHAEEESVASSKSGASGKKGKKSKKQKKRRKLWPLPPLPRPQLLRPFLFHASERHKGNDIDSDGEEEEFVHR